MEYGKWNQYVERIVLYVRKKYIVRVWVTFYSFLFIALIRVQKISHQETGIENRIKTKDTIGSFSKGGKNNNNICKLFYRKQDLQTCGIKSFLGLKNSA